MSYKSALTSNLSTEALASAALASATLSPTAQAHTFWEDSVCKEEELADYHNKWQKEQWTAFQRLRKSPTFQRKFDTFAENVLCIQDTDVEKGARLTLEPTRYWFEENIPKGKLRAQIGFWFLYRQDGFTYCVVYECDSLTDPRTGWFSMWKQKNGCGGSCDFHMCHYNYPKYLKKSEK